MKKKMISVLFPLFVSLVMAVAIWGPEALAGYKDKAILGQVHVEEVETPGAGYRYKLNSNERLYILSECLNSQILPESDQNALIREETGQNDYQELAGTYAFVLNHKGPSGKEITAAEIYETASRGILLMKELGILPDTVRPVEEGAYDAVLYSAIDVLEPRNNVAVWKLGLTTSQKNANKENRLIDAYIDADDGRIYELYVRTNLLWEQVEPDKIAEKWAEYMGLYGLKPYEAENPLLETTPYYQKYVFPGMGEEQTIMTIGFYEGINELFLKISR